LFGDVAGGFFTFAFAIFFSNTASFARMLLSASRSLMITAPES
jgi:hypothetical protein